VNFCLADGAWLLNENFQVFCQPVLWASVAILFFLVAFLAWPFVPEKLIVLKHLLLFIHGIGFCICVYCIYFEPGLYFFSTILILVGIGIFGLAPIIFLVQICFRIFKSKIKFGWISFLAGILMILSFQFYFSLQYKALLTEIEKIPLTDRTPEKLAAQLPKNYMSERFAGTHFRYHTAFCIYDGWRPPLHDPFLVISRWLYPEVDLSISNFHLEDRINMYRKMFPDKNAYADCYCADFNGDAKSYPKNEK
jgi:hypothetical protein